jgi:hypothetical protein
MKLILTTTLKLQKSIPSRFCGARFFFSFSHFIHFISIFQPSFVKTDFNRWKDEDDSESEADNPYNDDNLNAVREMREKRRGW